MTDELLAELLAARQARRPCALVTVAATVGSVPRAAGSKMLVYADGKVSGTIGGGKFESIVTADALASLRQKQPLLRKYPLREGEDDSFGAICGGEATIFVEPQGVAEAIFLIGAGHCARAIAHLALQCGLGVTIIDDRAELLTDYPAAVARVESSSPPDFIRSRKWGTDEALLMVSRNYEIDREALAAILATGSPGYVGMMGSRRKVLRVFDELRARGVPQDKLAKVHAPLGYDVGADSPAEIAVSVLAEVLAVLRKRTGRHMRLSAGTEASPDA
jgi:xanthine dehydrogenase accessory factor